MTFSAWCTRSCRCRSQEGNLGFSLSLYLGVIRGQSSLPGNDDLFFSPKTRGFNQKRQVVNPTCLVSLKFLTSRPLKATLSLENGQVTQRRAFWSEDILPHKPLIWMRHFTMSQAIHRLRTIGTCWSNFGQRSATTSNGWKSKLGNWDQTTNLSTCPEPSSVVVWRQCLPPLDTHPEVKCSNLV